MLLRYAGFFILLTLIGVTFWVIFIRSVADTGPPAQNERGPKANALGVKAVRLLDKISTDNTLIGDPKWRDEVDDVLKEWYGK